jgi:hypothetical protein
MARTDGRVRTGVDMLGKMATILGVLGGLFALAKGGHDFWNETHKSPRIDLITGEAPLDMTYDPVLRTVQFSFNIGVANSGTAADFITGGTATLERVAPPRQFLSASFFKFFDNDVELRIPVAVGTAYQKTLRCVVSSEPGRVADIEGSHDLSRLRVTLKGKDNTEHNAELCFYLTQEAVANLFGSQPLSFVSPNHCGEAP